MPVVTIADDRPCCRGFGHPDDVVVQPMVGHFCRQPVMYLVYVFYLPCCRGFSHPHNYVPGADAPGTAFRAGSCTARLISTGRRRFTPAGAGMPFRNYTATSLYISIRPETSQQRCRRMDASLPLHCNQFVNAILKLALIYSCNLYSSHGVDRYGAEFVFTLVVYWVALNIQQCCVFWVSNAMRLAIVAPVYSNLKPL